MNTSDRITALANSPTIDRAELRSIAVLVRRMEATLDDIVAEEQDSEMVAAWDSAAVEFNLRQFWSELFA